MFRKGSKYYCVDLDAGNMEDEMCSSISKIECGFVTQCSVKGKEVDSQLYGNGASLKDSNENILWGGKKVISGKSSINGCSVASPDIPDNLTEMSKPSVKFQHSLPSGYVSLARLLELKQSQKGKDLYCEVGMAVQCSFKNSISEQWHRTDLDNAERIEDGPQDKNGYKQRGYSGSKDRAEDKNYNEQKQKLNSGNNNQAQDRIEQRHKRNLETERIPEQLGRVNSGTNNIAQDKSIRKDNHPRMNEKTKSKALVNCSEMRGTEEMKEVRDSKQGNQHENLEYPRKAKIMCECISRIGDVSSLFTYKTEEMEAFNQGKTVPGLARKSEDISRKQLQIQSCKECERPDYCILKVDAGHKVNNGITGRRSQWRVKTSPMEVKVPQNDFHSCQQLKYHESNGISASDGNTGRANQINHRFKNRITKTCGNPAKNGPFNKYLSVEQLSAVDQILNAHGSLPHLVYGPPGTGKTTALVEAISQTLRINSNAHILACAPSDDASDILLERLLEYIKKRDIFRLNTCSRPFQDVQCQILPLYSHRDSLLKYKIVISSYPGAAMIYAQDVPPGHFTHIFLDESGQATQPESKAHIANLANVDTTVVLAVEADQLGHICSSELEMFGSGKTYLEHFSDFQLCSFDGEYKEYMTKLTINYRSHPAIIEIPSRLFYGSEMIACAAKERQESLCAWDELPNKKFPVLFIGIEGCDEREESSPSWFNTVELCKVIEIVKNLKDCSRGSITGKDIGIITSYNQQVIKLKQALTANTIHDVKVGSVEQFEGDEKCVIVISTVRSGYSYKDYVEEHNLGLLRNPKLFNVAVTRAKNLLVVVGNPYLLSKENHWNELLQYCLKHESYLGSSPPQKANEAGFICIGGMPIPLDFPCRSGIP